MKEIKINKSNKNILSFIKEYAVTANMLADASISYNSQKKGIQEELEKYIAVLAGNNERTPDVIKSEDDKRVDAEFAEKIAGLEVKLSELEKAYKSEIAPYKERQKKTLLIVDKKMYEAYIKKITEKKRGDFLLEIAKFADFLKIPAPTQAEISGTAESICDVIGGKLASEKEIKKGNYIECVNFPQFQKLFLASFCQLYIRVDIDKVKDSAKKIVDEAIKKAEEAADKAIIKASLPDLPKAKKKTGK